MNQFGALDILARAVSALEKAEADIESLKPVLVAEQKGRDKIADGLKNEVSKIVFDLRTKLVDARTKVGLQAPMFPGCNLSVGEIETAIADVNSVNDGSVSNYNDILGVMSGAQALADRIAASIGRNTPPPPKEPAAAPLGHVAGERRGVTEKPPAADPDPEL